MKGPETARTIWILIFFFFSRLLFAQDYRGYPHFYKMDADRDRHISHAEFYRGMDDTLLFERWDNNDDGAMDRQEVYDQIKDQSTFPVKGTLQQSSSEKRVQLAAYVPGQEEGKLRQLDNFFRLADLNRDNRLNKAEFYLFLFRQYDADENGSLVLTEFAAKSLQ